MATIRLRNGKFLARVRGGGRPIVSQTFSNKHAAYAWAARTEDEKAKRGAATLTALRDTWTANLSASTVARRFTMLRALYSYAKEDLLLPIEIIPAQVHLQEANDTSQNCTK